MNGLAGTPRDSCSTCDTSSRMLSLNFAPLAAPTSLKQSIVVVDQAWYDLALGDIEDSVPGSLFRYCLVESVEADRTLFEVG